MTKILPDSGNCDEQESPLRPPESLNRKYLDILRRLAAHLLPRNERCTLEERTLVELPSRE